MRLHAAMGERTGVYIGACVLERLSPSLVPPGHRPDELVVEPWPLPKAQEGRPFDGIIGDLPGSAALDLLREGVFYVADMQIGAPPTVDLAPSRSLPSNNATVIVARTLAGAMGVPHPLVFLDEAAEDTVVAHVTPVPCLVVGRRIASAPAGVLARDAIGRALLRLSTGGDGLHRHATPGQLVGLLHALAQSVGVEVELDDDVAPDMAFANAILEGLPSRDALDELHEVAVAFRNAAERFDVKALRVSLWPKIGPGPRAPAIRGPPSSACSPKACRRRTLPTARTGRRGPPSRLTRAHACSSATSCPTITSTCGARSATTSR
jgi:hypothetical protein